MNAADKPRWSLPYRTETPDDPRERRKVRIARVAAYCVLAAALIAPVVQFQHSTAEVAAKHEKYQRRLAAGRATREDRPGTKGAIARWSKAVRQFWAGENIYVDRRGEADDEDGESRNIVGLHPNMPFTVMLLTPFAYMPMQWQGLSWNLLKLAALAATFLMAARLAAHGRRRIPDWVLALGILWALKFIIGDIQHANTNTFVLAAVVFHLWLYRRGRDVAAGLPLALAICLKMTPALFVLYWLYQRNWKLLGGTVASLVLLAVIVPAAALGPAHYGELASTWGNELIVPGLVEGKWYPMHINQSLNGVASRYFLDGKWGDLNWNPDDNVYARQQEPPAHITLVALSPAALKWIVRGVQAAIVALGAWAIGWKRLGRDDGRRMLHYGLVACGILLLNQRTWDHHAGVLLIASVGVWQAIAYGRFSRAVRAVSIALTLAGGLVLWLTRSELAEGVGRLLYGRGGPAEQFANRVEAYGPGFFCFAALFAAGVILSVALRRKDDPYAAERQKLFA